MLPTGDSLQIQGHRDRKRGDREIYSLQTETKKAGVAILTSNKINFKTKILIRDKEGHHIKVSNK